MSIREAEQLHQQGNLALAKTQYEIYLKQHPEDADVWHMLGVLCAQQKEDQTALQHIHRAISFKPNDARYYNSLGNIYLQSKQFDQAEIYFQKSIQCDAHYAIAHNNLGNVFYQQNKFQLAQQSYATAITLQNNYADAHANLGMLLAKLERNDDATHHLKTALTLKPGFMTASHQLVQLAVIYFNQQDFKQAADLFECVLAAHATYPDIDQYLANTYLRLGDHPKALHYYFQQLTRAPLPETYYNIGVILMGQNKWQDALQYLHQAEKLNSNNIDIHLNCGSIYLKQNKIEKAILCYEKALKLKPHDPEIDYILSALKQHQTPKKAPREYLSHLFDQYAENYDRHLMTVLQYDVPQQLYQKMENIGVTGPLRIVDLGCGTGLAGVIFKKWAKELIGIDISEKMIAIAQSKNIYDQLIVGDIESQLISLSSVDLILAADVLPYVGDLNLIFSLVSQALSHSGLFAFSVETTYEKNFILQNSMRYAHSKTYLNQLISSYHFATKVFENSILRKQRHEPVHGYLVVLEKRGNEYIPITS